MAATTAMTTATVAVVAAAPAACAFAPSASFNKPQVSSTKINAEPEEEEGLDLNLEEMFDMFDAADKEETFDDAVKKIKSD